MVEKVVVERSKRRVASGMPEWNLRLALTEMTFTVWVTAEFKIVKLLHSQGYHTIESNQFSSPFHSNFLNVDGFNRIHSMNACQYMRLVPSLSCL